MAAIGFAGYYVGRFFYRMFATIFFTIIDIVTYIIRTIAERILATVLTATIVVGGAWLFWESNPELKREVKNVITQANGLLQQYAGISIPNIPGIEDIPDIISKGTSSASIREFSTLFDELGAKNIPKELGPILNIIQDRNSIDGYKQLLNSGGMGKNAEGAIPLLAKSLRGDDINLQSAAQQALKMINSPNAKKELKNYQKFIEDMVKNGR